MGLTPEQMQELQELEELERLEQQFGGQTVSQVPSEAVEPQAFARDEDSETIEEMHPMITKEDRAIIKNFAQSPKVGEEYLRSKYPGLEVGHEGDRMFLRTKGDKNYYVLDPDTGFFSKDILNDASDIAYDVGSSAAETAGAAVGAGLGLISPIPGGTIMGGMAGAGAVGAGAEAARQKIGQKLGLPQDVDMSDVAISGGLSAATAGLTGTTPAKTAVKQFAKNQINKGISKEAVEDLIKKSGEGLIKKSYNYGTRTVAPWMASKASGIDKGLIKSLGGRISELEALEKSGIRKFLSDSRKGFSTKFNQAKTAAGQKIDDFLGNVEGEVDIQKAKNILKGHIDELQSQYNRAPTKNNESSLLEAQGLYDDLFRLEHGGAKKVGSYNAPNKLESPELYDIGLTKAQRAAKEQQFKADQAYGWSEKTGYNVAKPGNITEEQAKRHASKVERLYGTEAAEDATKARVNIVDDPTQQIDWTTLQSRAKPTELSSSVDARLANRIKQDLSDYADTHKYTAGAITSRHGTGGSVGGKVLMNKADDARRAVVESLESSVDDPAYQATKQQYGYLKDQEKNLGNMFKSDKRYYRALRGLGSPANEVDREALEALDKLLGTKSLKDAEMMQLYSTFAKPSSSALSIGGSTSTSRTIPLASAGGLLGGYAGYQLSGGDMRGGTLGAGAGMLTGGALASPAALKFAIKRGLQAEKLGQRVTPNGNIGQVGAQSVWKILRDSEED